MIHWLFLSDKFFRIYPVFLRFTRQSCSIFWVKNSFFNLVIAGGYWHFFSCFELFLVLFEVNEVNTGRGAEFW